MDKYTDKVTVTISNYDYEQYVLFKNLKPQACFVSPGYMVGRGEFWWLGKDEFVEKVTKEAEFIKIVNQGIEYELEKANKKIAELEKQLKEKRKWWKIK